MSLESQTEAFSLASPRAISPLAWRGAMPGECYHNVQTIIQSLGGTPAFGWALAEYGPLLASGGQSVPLYGRWVNHVVWRDVIENLWEVTPNFDILDRTRIVWLATPFVPDLEAEFEIASDIECRAKPCRFVATCPEGRRVAHLLNQVACADNDESRAHWLRMALASLESVGLRPREGRIETVGAGVNNIWLIAE